MRIIGWLCLARRGPRIDSKIISWDVAEKGGTRDETIRFSFDDSRGPSPLDGGVTRKSFKPGLSELIRY